MTLLSRAAMLMYICAVEYYALHKVYIFKARKLYVCQVREREKAVTFVELAAFNFWLLLLLMVSLMGCMSVNRIILYLFQKVYVFRIYTHRKNNFVTYRPWKKNLSQLKTNRSPIILTHPCENLNTFSLPEIRGPLAHIIHIHTHTPRRNNNHSNARVVVPPLVRASLSPIAQSV